MDFELLLGGAVGLLIVLRGWDDFCLVEVAEGGVVERFRFDEEFK